MSKERVQLSPALLVETIGVRWPSDQVDAAIELLARTDGRFPAGVRKLPVELVKEIQRERLIVSMCDAAARIGYRETTVQDVIERAGVSRPTFYEHFANKDDCFLASFDASAERLRARISGAAAAGEGWRERLRLGLTALLGFVAAEPATARTLFVEARASSPAAALRRVELLDSWASCIDAEARELLAEPPTDLAPLTAAGVVGGLESVVYSRLCRDDLGALPELLPSLMYFAVLPYEGQEAAAEELATA